jgi:hypothetical protein
MGLVFGTNLMCFASAYVIAYGRRRGFDANQLLYMMKKPIVYVFTFDTFDRAPASLPMLSWNPWARGVIRQKYLIILLSESIFDSCWIEIAHFSEPMV